MYANHCVVCYVTDTVVLSPYYNARVLISSAKQPIRYKFPPNHTHPRESVRFDESDGGDGSDRTILNYDMVEQSVHEKATQDHNVHGDPCENIHEMMEAISAFSMYYYGDNPFLSHVYQFATRCSE